MSKRATAIEYALASRSSIALIAVGIGAAVAATVFSLGTTTAGLYQSVCEPVLERGMREPSR